MIQAHRFSSLIACLFLLTTISASTTAHAASKTKLTWYGHSAFKLTTPAGHVLLIDPWITNPGNQHAHRDLEALDKGKVDLILITHGHFDHVGNAVAIAKKTDAKLVEIYELGRALAAYAGYPKKEIGGLGNFGGTESF